MPALRNPGFGRARTGTALAGRHTGSIRFACQVQVDTSLLYGELPSSASRR